VEGVIQERAFTEGTVVQPGQLLYRIEGIRYAATYRSALARFENAQRQLGRLEPLLGQHAVAQLDVDNAQSEFAASQAALQRARDLDDTEVRAESTVASDARCWTRARG
jgi:membrane fusion protein (multidrug efflux system)